MYVCMSRFLMRMLNINDIEYNILIYVINKMYVENMPKIYDMKVKHLPEIATKYAYNALIVT